MFSDNKIYVNVHHTIKRKFPRLCLRKKEDFLPKNLSLKFSDLSMNETNDK